MRSGGSIVLNGLVMRQLGMPGTSAYSASKAAVTGMAKVMAGELTPRGIRVNNRRTRRHHHPDLTRGARAGTPIEEKSKRRAALRAYGQPPQTMRRDARAEGSVSQRLSRLTIRQRLMTQGCAR